MKNKDKYCDKEPFGTVIAYTTLSRKYVTANPENPDRFPMYSDWLEMEAEEGYYGNVSDILAEELFESIKKAGIDLNDVSGFKRAVDNFGLEIKHLSLMISAERTWIERMERKCKEQLERDKLNKEE